MTSRSELLRMSPKDRAAYGGAVVKDAAYEAIQTLWRRRKDEGWTQVQVAASIGADTGWLSRNLRGPANWTFATFGALVEALDGEVEITVHALEDPLLERSNYDAYAEYEGGLLARLQRDELQFAPGRAEPSSTHSASAASLGHVLTGQPRSTTGAPSKRLLGERGVTPWS